MNTPLDTMRQFFDLGGVLSIIAQSTGLALIRVVNSKTSSWVWPLEEDGIGVCVGTIAGWLNRSKRHVRRGLAELEDMGICKRERRFWNTTRYHLFPARVAELARLATTAPMKPAETPVLERGPTPGAQALARAAEDLGADLPSWTRCSERPGELARLAWCWARSLYTTRAEENVGLFARQIETLRKTLSISEERFAELLIAVGVWVREEGRLRGHSSANTEIVDRTKVLRPRLWARVVNDAVQWYEERQRRASEPAFVAKADDDAELFEAAPAVPAAPEPPRVEKLLAELAQLVPEVEQVDEQLATLPELPKLQDGARPWQRSKVERQADVRAELRERVDAWLSHTRAALTQPANASSVALHDLAAAMARIRTLKGLLAR